MTAVMRAMQQATGPKVLRIGLLASGRILEERIIKQRTSVTVGPSEKSTFVVQANVPPQFKLFELIGNDYHLNFLDGMTGRVALATGITDLVALKGQAKRVGPAYQIRLTEEARGKIVIGETTFLFQFVAPPPAQPRPQLPLSVKGGLASQIDWSLTIIAAFSFLLHFGLIGAMYSDWMDPVVNEDITAGLMNLVRDPPTPPPVETAETPATTATSNETAQNTQTHSQSNTQATHAGPSVPNVSAVNNIMGELAQLRVATIGALAGGPSISSVMNGEGAPVDLNGIVNGGGISNLTGGLNLPGGAGGPIQPGKGTGDLSSLGGGKTIAGDVNTAGTAKRVVPVGTVDTGPASANVPIANMESVIRSQIFPAARKCYQRGLENDPNQSGKLIVAIKVDPSGEVSSASVVSNSGLSQQVASCIVSAAKRATFGQNPGGTVQVPFNFVHQ
jgi:outer membrane biosynthesis protein TonB